MRRTVAVGGRPLSAAPFLLWNAAGRNNLSIITPPHFIVARDIPVVPRMPTHGAR